MKDFIGSCVDNPFKSTEELCNIIDEAKKISRKKFLENCYIERELIKSFKQYPYSYEFYQNENIMFFTWSAIEHFFN